MNTKRVAQEKREAHQSGQQAEDAIFSGIFAILINRSAVARQHFAKQGADVDDF